MARLGEFIYDEQILPAIIEVIDGAKEHLVLVSPYNNYPQCLCDALERARTRKPRIVAVYRKKSKTNNSDRKSRDQLRKFGADIYSVKKLHAKVYYNESSGVVTSMNLLKSSVTTSREIGFKITDAEMLKEIRKYVEERLVAHKNLLGLCIRCRDEIPYDPGKPMCFKHYRNWKRYPDLEYPQEYCHYCGEEQPTALVTPVSFKTPLCGSCYK